jgi:hypothetical protein
MADQETEQTTHRFASLSAPARVEQLRLISFAEWCRSQDGGGIRSLGVVDQC